MEENLELYFDHPACAIYFNPELRAVQTKWKGLYSQGNEFRMILDKIIELLEIKKVNLIIADARKMKIISPEDQQWIVQDWHPRAVEAGFNFEVLIVAKHSFNERSIKQIVQHYDNKKIRTIYFYTFKDASHWLLNNVAIWEKA